ncbi:MAG: beta-ketoacyl synthase N-terminal-like domain-containing protein, partial [Trichodesmium sp. St5_bin2_1]|nr:beta-ketoacyl synthase N-terminal-like domain-containing protein [Trichodesmium sp. St5_bin2_1]
EVVREIQIAVSTEHELEVYGVILLKTGSIPKTSSGKIQRRACKLGFQENSLNVVGKWQKNREENSTLIISSNSQLDCQDSSSPNQSKTVAEIEVWLVDKVATLLQIAPEKIDLKQPLAVYGLNSVNAVSMAGELEEWLGISVVPTIVYDYPSIQGLADYLGRTTPLLEFSTSVSNPQSATEAVAVIGKGCRFPKANNPQAFWSLLRSGDDVITKVPISRWQSENCWGGFLEQIDQFDPQFFGISPRETSNMDPQQRLLLEVSWEALENAGLAVEKLARSRGGVFIGISSGDYATISGNLSNTETYYGTGNALSIAANRLSYFLDWRGPSWAVDTACSSSLVAVHQACQSLLQRECNLALAGGVNLILTPQLTMTFSQAQMLAKDGRCKTFDADADGYVRSEGCGVVVLKRLEDAVAHGDKIQAIIRGSAVNQDGQTNGLTAPNGQSQQEVIRLALAKAGVKPSQISYVETHGTGTTLGDPIEVNSLKAVMMEGRESNQPCWIGSVKTNVGHLEAAAGIAGLIKLVLSLEHREIPPHLHLKKLNPYIELEQTEMEIPTQLQPWLSGEEPRRAGVSAFGFGGTNAHVILEEAPSVNNAQLPVTNNQKLERSLHVLTLSAKTEKALEELSSRYQNHLETHRELAIADICFTANTGRSHFNHRLAIIASDRQELVDKLGQIRAREEPIGVFSSKFSSNSKAAQIAFLFTGQGSQYIYMGRQLYETQPRFREALEECDQILQSYLETSILEIIYPKDEQKSSLVDQTAYTQPAIFALEYALFKLWDLWGIRPNVVMGHSVGEYVAACIAGVFSLEDGLKLIAMRGKLMQKLPSGGEMVSVMASESQVTEAIKEYTSQVTIAAVNGPESIVISGESGAIATICDILKNMGIKTKKLQVSHAFHSPLMEPMLTEFAAVAKQVTYNEPKIPLISNVTGTEVGAEITMAEYWVGHVRQPVRFATS